jgi:hypothetical protein
VRRLLIYASSVDHHNPADWYRYRDRIRETLERANITGSIVVDDDPLFSYGVDVSSALARVNAAMPRRGEIVLAQWSTVVFYAASVLFVGDGVDARAIGSALSEEPFLKEHTGDYALESATCYAYALYPYEDADVASTRRLVECVPRRVYVGAPELLNDEEGTLGTERFEVLRRREPTRPGYLDGVVAFRPRTRDVEEEVWRLGARLDGLAVVAEDDPRLPVLMEPTDLAPNELTLFMGEEAGPRLPRVTIQRCHMDDAIVCLYNHPYVEGAPLQFVV